MPEALARIAVGGLYAYLGVGLLVAASFALRGVDRIDPRGAGSSWGFRLVILPGCVALWPLVLRRWVVGGPPPERSAHRLRSAERAR